VSSRTDESHRLEIANRHPSLTAADDVLRRAVLCVFAHENVTASDVSLVLTGDEEIHRLNREFLNHDYPTDVLSFPLSDDDSPSASAASQPRRVEGELIVSLDTARRVADREGWSLEAEVVLYVVHGLLHLCGYDDQTDVTRLMMRKREREILSALQCSAAAGSALSGGDEVHS
jgi:probable rRNA maturation factor